MSFVEFQSGCYLQAIKINNLDSLRSPKNFSSFIADVIKLEIFSFIQLMQLIGRSSNKILDIQTLFTS